MKLVIFPKEKLAYELIIYDIGSDVYLSREAV